MAEIVVKVADTVVRAIKLQAQYLSSYEDILILNELKQEVEDLNGLRESVIHEVEAERREGRELQFVAVKWLEKVDKALQHADQLCEDAHNYANAVRSFPDMMSRLQLAQKAWKLTAYLNELSSDRFDHITTGHIEELESRQMMKEDIALALREYDVFGIGIYGLAGVGKTVLAEQVAQQVKGDMFDVVSMITVSQTPDVEGIQCEIADLHERIKKGESVLIILDDVWDTIVFERLEIPIEHVLDEGGCKFLLTTRNPDILDMTETQMDFCLQLLNDAESWRLFQSRAGDALKDTNLQDIAKKLVRRCGGWPLAIVTLAASLQGRGVSYWKEALRILDENAHMGMNKTIYSIVGFSYNQLEDDEVKQVFLLCGLHGPSISVSDLLKYAIGLGVFKHVISIDDARSKLHRIIADLEEKSLLLRYSAREVNVHVIICEVASSIATRDGHVFTMERTAPLEYWPSEDFLRRCSQIILESNYIQELPERLDCPNLCFLYLNTNDNPTLEIPHSFFEGMGNLQVLVLIGMTISSLPASLDSLAKLKTLCFNKCCLQDLVGIRALKCLEILSFFKSSIKEFPSEIGQLTCLRMLDLSSSKIKVIPPNIISNLTKLEELYTVRPIKWDLQSLAVQKEHDILAELTRLSHTALELQIPEAWILPCSIIFEKLERCNIVIGDKWDWSDSNETSRSLNLKLDPNIHLEQEIKEIVKIVEDLYFEEINDFSNVLYDMNHEGFPLLNKLHIQNNTNIQHIVYSSVGNQTPVPFSNLETMILDNLNNLKEICHGPLSVDLFEKLKVIKVKSCGRLEYLFSVSKIKKISQLVEIEVSECSSMKNIVLLDSGTTTDEIQSIEDIDDNDAVLFGGLLNKLRQLCLLNLDSLTSIVGFNIHWRIFKFKMLNNLVVRGCNQLKYLLPLYVLEDLQQLKYIDISYCEKMEQVFVDDEQDTQTTKSNVMKMFLPLPSLKLSNLPELESIYSGADRVIIRSLTQMTVENCPKFIFTFAYHWRCFEEQEPSEKKSKEMIVTPSKLENLNLRKLNHLTKMSKDHLVRFMHMTSLQLWNCNKLEYLFSLSMAQELSYLQELKISSCERIQQIVKRETEENASANTTIEFPQVKALILEQLPKFTGSSSQDGVIWLALDTVQIFMCPNIQKLGMVDISVLKNVNVENFSSCEDLEKNMASLFDFTDELSRFEYLKIEDSKQLKKYMDMNLKASSLSRIRILEARQCDQELNKFLTILFRRSHGLEELTIANSELLEKVFDLTEFVAEEQRNRIFPNLNTMKLLYLPNLNCIWNKDPRGVVEFGKLVKLEIIECGLRNSPLSTALLEKLVLLEALKIESCEMIEQVVEDDREMQERSFRNLKHLQLSSLPKLIKFNSRHCNFRFPNLLSLRIEKCPKLNAFTTGFLSNQKLTIEGTSDHVPSKEMMYGCPRLQTLKLVGLEMLENIWQGQYSLIPFCDLTTVEVDSLSRLSYLRIPMSEKLETLVVRNCSSLGRLVQPSNCFNLREIKISSCNILEKISTDLEQEKTDKNAFRHLESIVLENLPELSFFSLVTYEFPLLKKLRIVNCPALETSPKNVSAKTSNSLNKNSASLVLFDDIKKDSPASKGKMKIPPQLVSLELINLPNMQLWNQEPKNPMFQNLTILKIVGNQCIKELFSISVAEHLSVLKLIILFDCVNMVQVLRGGGGNSTQVFQKLETLVLKHMPRLTSFCEDNVDFGEFPELKMVRVEHIPEMITFVKKPLNTPKLKQVYVTCFTKCWLGDLNQTIAYLHQNHDKLKDEVWEPDQSSTRHHMGTAESSSQGKLEI